MSDDIEPRNFHLLIEILQKETEGIHFDPTVVQARLAVVMNSVGIFVPTDDMSDKEIEYSKIFFEQSNNPAYTPREKVQHYKKILESSDPLGEGLTHSIFRAEINARARSRTARGLKNPYVKSYLSNDRLPNLAITIARHWLKLDEEEIRELRGWAKRLRSNRKGLTQKNDDRLRQFRDEKVLRALFTLPDRILAHDLRKAPDSRSALRIQTALAIAILSVAPLRIENLRSLDRDVHFVGAFSEKAPVLQIRIKAQDVKNDVDLAYPVPDEVGDLLELYMAKYQPLLTNGCASSLLFPSRSGAPKNANSLRRNITNRIRNDLGLHVHPHLFRHLAARIFLDRYPGHYEEVRRVLHHRNIQTTIDSYAGLEAATALNRYDDIVLSLKEGAA